MAPACTLEFYRAHYEPRLGTAAGDGRVGLPKLTLYCLSKKLELDDNVAFAYRKSLLHLISQALERKKGTPVLGLARDHGAMAGRGLDIVISGGDAKARCASTSHGGFDNDYRTLNDVMKTMLGSAGLPHPFTKEELEGY